MQTIVLAGWRAGLQKVELANLQRELLHLSLKEAKQNVDQLLDAEEETLPAAPVVLLVPDEVAAEFSRRADALGALVGHVNFSAARTPRPRPATGQSQQAA